MCSAGTPFTADSPAVGPSRVANTLKNVSDAPLSLSQVAEIRAIHLRLLGGIKVGYPEDMVVTPEFLDACWQQAKAYRFPLSGRLDLGPYIRFGAIVACATYDHVDVKRRIFMTLYTASLAQLDDAAAPMDGCNQFTTRMMQGLPQSSANLDGLVRLIQDTSCYSGPSVLADIAIANTFNYFAGIALENMSTSMPIHPQAESYTSYKRYLSGIADFYTMIAFPPDIPLEAYIQAVPDISRLSCLVNDVLSFYKEEMTYEDANLVTDLAKLRGITRMQAVQQLTDECIDLNHRIIAILGDSTAAREAYDAYMHGYVQFHTTAARYRLKELDIPIGAPFG